MLEITVKSMLRNKSRPALCLRVLRMHAGRISRGRLLILYPGQLSAFRHWGWPLCCGGVKNAGSRGPHAKPKRDLSHMRSLGTCKLVLVPPLIATGSAVTKYLQRQRTCVRFWPCPIGSTRGARDGK
ncbi:hypothetical protein BCR44DRAFT_1215309 [Catenaria anguillulae PL171]|uniref:Uncharacterized protein n=1 Tax=Catenaria anguillulae PL171 TaxID=765915 RepID=A0A1Y2HYU1_9FUNG|nr:hypothetical protein BCR44DRAFT_1215309 [Catenaria anguillulae PL171]